MINWEMDDREGGNWQHVMQIGGDNERKMNKINNFWDGGDLDGENMKNGKPLSAMLQMGEDWGEVEVGHGRAGQNWL